MYETDLPNCEDEYFTRVTFFMHHGDNRVHQIDRFTIQMMLLLEKYLGESAPLSNSVHVTANVNDSVQECEW